MRREHRTPHGCLVSIRLHCARHTKRRRSRPGLEAYLASPEFLASFQALDHARRLCALQAVALAYDRLATPADAPASPAPRVRWTDDRVAQLRKAAARCRTDRELAGVLGLPIPKTKIARWTYCGPKAGAAMRLAA
jgi:hypothetical protein